jgi:hypothetical protein
MQIHNLDNELKYCEAQGLANCFQSYAENCCNGDSIMEVGFNPNSGYVYIALENGISICSMLGRDVEYLVTSFEDGEEFFFDTYDEAVAKMESM